MTDSLAVKYKMLPKIGSSHTKRRRKQKTSKKQISKEKESFGFAQCEPTFRKKRLWRISQIKSRLSQIIKCHIHWVLLTTSSVRTNTHVKTSRFLRI